MNNGNGNKGFKCECGKWNAFDAYVYAHWRTRLVHQCKCTRKHSVIEGVATLIPQNLKRKQKAKV